ncbi:hypothetical protein [Enterobacter soli]|uniref:hypothetical protein n=1 Tax=Enterobacter soli TaxID=885040 RepID=UPI003ED92493
MDLTGWNIELLRFLKNLSQPFLQNTWLFNDLSHQKFMLWYESDKQKSNDKPGPLFITAWHLNAQDVDRFSKIKSVAQWQTGQC